MHVHKYCYLVVWVHVAASVSVPANTSANPAHTHTLLWICLYQKLHARHFQVSTFRILCWGCVSTYHIRGTHGYVCIMHSTITHIVIVIDSERAYSRFIVQAHIFKFGMCYHVFYIYRYIPPTCTCLKHVPHRYRINIVQLSCGTCIPRFALMFITCSPIPIETVPFTHTYIYTQVYVYVYLFIYIYIYTHTHINLILPWNLREITRLPRHAPHGGGPRRLYGPLCHRGRLRLLRRGVSGLRHGHHRLWGGWGWGWDESLQDGAPVR